MRRALAGGACGIGAESMGEAAGAAAGCAGCAEAARAGWAGAPVAVAIALR